MSIDVQINPIIDHYFCKIKLPTLNTTSNGPLPIFIVILDSSGSMGHHTRKICTQILPQVFNTLNYPPETQHHIIDFQSNTSYKVMTSHELQKNPICSAGCTFISPTFKKLISLLNSDTQYRLLVISDGDVHDIDQALEEANQAKTIIKNYKINVQTVRYFTSSSQPDTRALASFLQFNTITKPILVDVDGNGNDYQIATTISNLFLDDTVSYTLSTPVPIFKSKPWSTTLTDKITVYNEQSSLWLSMIPDKIKINDKEYTVNNTINDPISEENVHTLLSNELDKHLNYLKLLKVVNNEVSRNEIIIIVDYFSKLEHSLLVNSSQKNDSASLNSLKHRCNVFKNVIDKKKKSLFHEFARIANDEKVSKLNSANMATWLRTMDVSKNTKALARRATTNNNAGSFDALDFSGILRSEVLNMKNNFHEIEDIDSSQHNASFYSQATTLDGIRELCSNTVEIINELEATDILQLVNIVGVACNATIGDYPDSMSFRVTNMFPGCYISISDLTFISEQNTKYGTPNIIYPPGLPQVPVNQITNVIPIFENKRIHTFLLKYAPNMLEFSASVGMRRIISGVHMTYCYTLCGGLWKLVELLDKNKSTINACTFNTLTDVYNYVADKHFNHMLKLVDKPISPGDEDLSYFINNSGITNMINPIYNMIKTGKTQYLSNVIRSAYSYEASQMIRSYLKKLNHQDRKLASLNTLKTLLGINYNKYGKSPNPTFVPEDPNIKFHDGYELNDDLYKQLVDLLSKLDYVVLLPDLFTTIIKNNDDKTVELIKMLPPLNDEYFGRVLGINYDINYFKLATIVQSLQYFDKRDRVDSENLKMLITDLENFKNAKFVITNFITRQYKEYYGNQLVAKKNEEKKLMINKLVNAMCNCTTLKEYKKLFKYGLEYEGTTFKILNINSLGFSELLKQIFESPNTNGQGYKLSILFLGTYEDKIIWNGGNSLRVVLSNYKEMFKNLNLLDTYKYIKSHMRSSLKHIYRSLPNRQGHSNDFPSFYAFGYLSMEAMKANVTKEFWDNYNREHHNCCGNITESN